MDAFDCKATLSDLSVGIGFSSKSSYSFNTISDIWTIEMEKPAVSLKRDSW